LFDPDPGGILGLIDIQDFRALSTHSFSLHSGSNCSEWHKRSTSKRSRMGGGGLRTCRQAKRAIRTKSDLGAFSMHILPGVLVVNFIPLVQSRESGDAPPHDLLKLIWWVITGFFRSRASREAENVTLRHRLNVLQRKAAKRLFSAISTGSFLRASIGSHPTF
jgi:hypothetical protein